MDQRNYDLEVTRIKVIEWGNHQRFKRKVPARIVSNHLLSLAMKAEKRGQVAGADWLRFTAASAAQPYLWLSYVPPWAVLTHLDGKRFKQMFHDKPTATARMKTIKRKHPGAKVYLVNVYRPQDKKPPDLQLEPGQLYCPWCGAGRRFKRTEYGYTRCPICHISTENYYTRKANGLMDHSTEESREGRREMRRRKKESRRRVRGQSLQD
jgi:hypothetical protein